MNFHLTQTQDRQQGSQLNRHRESCTVITHSCTVITHTHTHTHTHNITQSTHIHTHTHTTHNTRTHTFSSLKSSLFCKLSSGPMERSLQITACDHHSNKKRILSMQR